MFTVYVYILIQCIICAVYIWRAYVAEGSPFWRFRVRGLPEQCKNRSHLQTSGWKTSLWTKMHKGISHVMRHWRNWQFWNWQVPFTRLADFRSVLPACWITQVQKRAATACFRPSNPCVFFFLKKSALFRHPQEWNLMWVISAALPMKWQMLSRDGTNHQFPYHHSTCSCNIVCDFRWIFSGWTTIQCRCIRLQRISPGGSQKPHNLTCWIKTLSVWGVTMGFSFIPDSFNLGGWHPSGMNVSRMRWIRTNNSASQKVIYKYSSRASRWRKFQKKKEPYSRERICL